MSAKQHHCSGLRLHQSKTRRLRSALWGMLLFASAPGAAAQEPPETAPRQAWTVRGAQGKYDAQRAPLDLSGKPCQISPERRSGGSAGWDSVSDIVCGDEQAGFLLKSQAVSPSSDASGSTPPNLDRMANFLRAKAGAACEGTLNVWVGGQELRALTCRNIADGWPSIALISETDNTLRVAFGSASSFPYLAHLLGADISGPQQQFANLAAVFWPTLVPLGASTDRSRLTEQRAVAREAGERLDFATAQARLETALEIQTRLFGETDFTTAALLLDLAMVLAYQEDFEAAQAIIRRAGPIIDQSPRPGDRARLSGYQASIAALQGDYAAAREFAQDATSKWRQMTTASDQQALVSLFQSAADDAIEAQPELALSLAREATILLKLDDPISAYAKAGEALFALNAARQKPPIWRSEILSVLGETASALGRLSAAEAFFEKAIAVRRTHQGDGPGMVRLLLAQGRTYQREAMNVNAIIAYRNAIGIAKQLPRGSLVLRVEDLFPFAQAVLAEVQVLEAEDEQLGLTAELYDAFQMAFVPGRDEALDLASVQVADADPALTRMIDSLKQSVLAQSEVRGKLAIERIKPTAERNDDLVAGLIEKLEIHTASAEAVRATIAQQRPEYQRLAENRLPDLGTLRSALRKGEALASFLIGQDTSFLQLVTRERIYITPIAAGEKALDQMVQELRKGLEIEGGSVNEFKLSEAYFLYETLFGGVAEPLAKVNRLIVVPNGPLSSLPFGTLLTSPPQNEDYRTAAWLVNRMAITQAPSIVSFVNLRSTRPVAAPPRPFLGIANPSFTRAGSALLTDAAAARSCGQLGLAELNRFDTLAPLPDTLDEVSSVIASLGIANAELLADMDASEQAVRGKNLSEYNIIYVATHAVMPGELSCQLEPGIALARPDNTAISRSEDGFLDASEVAALRLAANLVVLSACNTASSGNSAVQKGDALSGLAESFFIAGARSLLVTHWQVPSAATTKLMLDLFRVPGSEPGVAIDMALRRAQLQAIGTSDTAHPFFWGAFSFVGSGTETLMLEGPGA
jgi:CHAT domain-containing protein